MSHCAMHHILRLLIPALALAFTAGLMPLSPGFDPDAWVMIAPLAAGILARGISGAPLKTLPIEGPVAAIGALAALAAMLTGVGLAGTSAFFAVATGWPGPIFLGNFALGWLGGALLIDLGLALLLTRALPWRDVRWLSPLVAAPGAIAALSLVVAILIRPERHGGSYVVLPSLLGIVGLTMAVLLTGPLPRALRRVCQVGTVLTGFGFSWFILGGWTSPEVVTLSLCGCLLVWHGLAGPVAHRIRESDATSPVRGDPAKGGVGHLLPARLSADPVRPARELAQLGDGRRLLL